MATLFSVLFDACFFYLNFSLEGVVPNLSNGNKKRRVMGVSFKHRELSRDARICLLIINVGL